MKPQAFIGNARQRGLTLVEILVALAIGLIVAIAALATLLAGRTGFTTVDNTSQLVDRERFAVDTMTRVIAQAGFEDLAADPMVTRGTARAAGGAGSDPEPDIFGWNDAGYVAPSSLRITTSTSIADGDRDGKCGSGFPGTACRNGSDVLLVRFQGSGTPADGTMVNCRGQGEPGLGLAGDLDARALNVFYVANDANGEPALYCAYYNHAASPPAWVAGQPLIEGVETLQVLYGTDQVTPSAAPGTGTDTIVDRWLRADQLKVTGDAASTKENFRRVRAIRVGLVLRGPVGSAQEFVTATMTPLGASYASSSDKGTSLAVAADGRLRRTLNFTVHIRNDLGTR